LLTKLRTENYAAARDPLNAVSFSLTTSGLFGSPVTCGSEVGFVRSTQQKAFSG
jgi:hypothetical protein